MRLTGTNGDGIRKVTNIFYPISKLNNEYSYTESGECFKGMTIRPLNTGYIPTKPLEYWYHFSCKKFEETAQVAFLKEIAVRLGI